MVLTDDQYRPPLFLWNSHVHTLYASLYRKPLAVPYQRERWVTPDADFIDVDLLDNDSNQLLIIGHGLEGNSRRPYITNTAQLFNDNGWDVCAWNCRSCSEEMNKKPKLYSHADTADLQFIVEKLQSDYDQIVLLGYSMGGAIIMNYLGKEGKDAAEKISAAIAISAPCDIEAASYQLEKGINRLYKNYFMESLKEKIKLKARQFPELLDVSEIDQIKTWRDFDNKYSAPLGGYKDADDFYFHCSAIHRIPDIRVPTLLLNAWDDPILSRESYPQQPIKENNFMHALYTKKGGHVAFLRPRDHFSFAEAYAFNFVDAVLSSEKQSFYKQFEKL
jgi:hypothetical protein